MQEIKFEFYEKGPDVLLILTGVGGTTKGYANKYERIAQAAMQKFNLSVVVATTPSGAWMQAEQCLNKIMDFVRSKKSDGCRVYAMGHSMGANLVLWHFAKFPEIKKVLAVNPVLTVNLHLFSRLQNIKKPMQVVFGENDESCKFAEMLPKNIKVDVLVGVDHSFTKHLDLFIQLPEKYLLASF